MKSRSSEVAGRGRQRRVPAGRQLLACVAVAVVLGACSSKDQLAAGRESLAKGDYAAAVVALRFAAQESPKSVPVRLLLAEALERRHDLAGAEEQLRKALEHGGKADELVPRIALMMLDRGDFEALVRHYKDLRLDDAQADSSLRGAVALALLSLKRDAQAAAQVAEAQPVPSVRLARAQALVNEGRVKQALAVLELERADAPPPWWVLRAGRRIAAAAGEPALSLDLIRRAHEAVPWHLGVMGEYGEALITAARYDDALQLRDRLARVAPQFFWTNYLSALIFSRNGRLDEAHAAALSVLKRSPEHEGSVLIAASVELRRGDVAQAEQRLGTLVQRNPESLRALRLLAQAQYRLGRGEEARATLQRGLHLQADDDELLLLRARMDLASGRAKDAVPGLVAVTARHPDDVESTLLLVQARAAAGDRAGARQTLDQLQPKIGDAALGARVVEAALAIGDAGRAQALAKDLLSRFPKEPQARLAVAATLSLQGDAGGAWGQTLAVLDEAPQHGGALVALAALARTPDQVRELIARHEKAMQAGGGGPQQVLDYAALLRFQGGSGSTPAAVLEHGVKLYPAATALQRAWVEELLRRGEAERAISAAQAAAAVANAPVVMQEILATTYARVGKREQAAQTLRKLVKDFPERWDWTLALAGVEAESGRTNEAVSLLRRVVSERPADATAYRQLALLSARISVDEGLSVARQFGTRPEFAGAALLLAGDVLLEAGQPAAALAQYRAAVKAGVEPAGNLRALDALARNGQQAVADQELAQLLRSHPDHPSVLGFAAAHAQRQGAPAKAVEYLQRIARKAPNDPVLLNDLAWAQLAAGRPEALGNARKALAALPNNPNVLHTMGMVLARAGQRKEAIAALREAANLAPTKAMPKLNLAQMLAESGDKTGAAAALRGLDEAQLAPSDKQALQQLQGKLKG